MECSTHSDFELIVGNSTFKVHKCILAARSSYFRAMFEHEMKENTENKVKFDDMEEDVASDMIKFIYTGYAPKLPIIADRLVKAADKYNLDQLRNFVRFR